MPAALRTFAGSLKLLAQISVTSIGVPPSPRDLEATWQRDVNIVRAGVDARARNVCIGESAFVVYIHPHLKAWLHSPAHHAVWV